MDYSEVGAFIAQARIKQSISQQELAQYARISRRMLSDLERGIKPEFGLNKFLKLLSVLGLQMEVIPEPPPPTLDDINRENNERDSHRRQSRGKRF